MIRNKPSIKFLNILGVLILSLSPALPKDELLAREATPLKKFAWGVRPATPPSRISRSSWAFFDSDLTCLPQKWGFSKAFIEGNQWLINKHLHQDLFLEDGYVRRGRLTSHYRRSGEFWWRFQWVESQRFDLVWLWPVSHTIIIPSKVGWGPWKKTLTTVDCHREKGIRAKVWATWFLVVIVNVNFDAVDGRNPAPPGMYENLYIMGQTTNLNWLAGFLPSTVALFGLAGLNDVNPLFVAWLRHVLPQFLTPNVFMNKCSKFQLQLLIGHGHPSSRQKVFPFNQYYLYTCLTISRYSKYNAPTLHEQMWICMV